MCHTSALFLLNVFIILVPTDLPCTGRGGDFAAELGWPVMAEWLQTVKGYFSRSRDMGISQCSKVCQHEGNLSLDTKSPTLYRHYWRIYSRTVGFLLRNCNLVPCNSRLLNRGLKTFSTGWAAHEKLSCTAVASSTQSEMPGTAATKKEQVF